MTPNERRRVRYWENVEAERGAARERARAARAANPEKMREAARLRRAANPEKVRARERAYRAANPERADKDRMASRAWREANPERSRAIQKEWRETNPERANKGRRRRRARKAENGAFIVLARDLRRILSSPCLACGSTDRVTIDHRVPIARGGHDGVGNYAPLCLPCNVSKGPLTYAEWRYSDRPRARLVFGTNPTERNER